MNEANFDVVNQSRKTENPVNKIPGVAGTKHFFSSYFSWTIFNFLRINTLAGHTFWRLAASSQAALGRFLLSPEELEPFGLERNIPFC